MPLIETVIPETASGKVADVYRDTAPLNQQWDSMGYHLRHLTLSFPLRAAPMEARIQFHCAGFRLSR